MTTQGKHRLCLMLGAGCTLAMLAAVALWMKRRDKVRLEDLDLHEVSEMRYSVRRNIRGLPDDVVKVDGSIQLTFPGDTRISPGSLAKMTEYMREEEIEIATKLAREFEVPK
jgi:hypothetical protein